MVLTDDDWVMIWADDGEFRGAGDPHKLGIILQAFRDWATSHQSGVDEL
jgi:hypothetical protein